MRSPVYLDNNATTPIDRRVRECMIPLLFGVYGNPQSRDHPYGRDAARALEEARCHVAQLINAKPAEIIFTSCATESVNLALKGLTLRRHPSRPLVVTSVAEHPAVLAVCRQLEATGTAAVEYVPVTTSGQVDLVELARRVVAGRTLVVSLMRANNETGTVHPIAAAAKIAHAAQAVFFTDATQAVGKIPVDVRADHVDLLAFSGHKLYGPKGTGALFVRDGQKKIQLEPLLAGGGQEGGLRSGTPNVAGIVGFGEACRIARLELADDSVRMTRLRDRLEQDLLRALTNVRVNGDVQNRLPNTTNLCFRGVDAGALARALPRVAISTQSACASGSCGSSHVLVAIGRSDQDARCSIRFSLGRFTTDANIDSATADIIAAVRALRSR